MELQLPCGKCIGCKMDRAKLWSLRIQHEASLYDRSVFATLSYADEHLPRSLSLEYPHFQAFMRRLRRRRLAVSSNQGIRFFAAGEYGSRYRRPHWHVILFNCHFPDSDQWWNGSCRSTIADEVWGKGDVHLGEVNAQSAAYVAGYTLEKRYGPSAVDHYEDVCDRATGELFSRRPEFVQMSRRPGIGSLWYDRFRADLYKGFVTRWGDRYSIPRFYMNRLEKDEPIRFEELKFKRIERAEEFWEWDTPGAREAREAVAEARWQLYGQREH